MPVLRDGMLWDFSVCKMMNYKQLKSLHSIHESKEFNQKQKYFVKWLWLLDYHFFPISGHPEESNGENEVCCQDILHCLFVFGQGQGSLIP